MSFFDNLAMIMGGDENIPPAFKDSLGEFQQMTVSGGFAAPTPVLAVTQVSAPMTAAPATMDTATQPMNSQYAVRGGFFGLGSDFDYPTSNFTEADPNTITTGAGGGLYGGNVNYNPSDSAYGNINPSNYLADKKKGASNLNAAVQRAQYQDYLNRFAPVEDYLVGQVNGRNTQDLGYDVARANQSVANAGLNLQGQQERAMGRFGLATRAPSIATSNEITGGQVAAMNQARIADEARALQLMSGSGNQAGG